MATRSRPCYGDPPRQLPDPRSPACAATIFEGDNGGSTAPGVTSTEIRVAWPTDSNTPQALAPIRALFDYVNNRFELYGRRLVLVPQNLPPTQDTAGQRAWASDIAGQGVFAALELSVGRWYPSWFQELARQHVISITSSLWSFLSDRETFDALHPYVWSVYPSAEQLWTNLASLACTALASRPASHAGAALQSTTRKFGILAAGTERRPSVTALVSAFSSCNQDVPVTEWVSARDGSAARTTAIAKLRDAGVTTVMCACADTIISSLAPAVQDAGWQPEWLFTGLTGAVFDEYQHQSYLPADQRAHVFGLQPLGPAEPAQNQWWWRALLESGVSDVATALTNVNRYIDAVYDQLLVLATGIQAAGPQLTADTFAQGLMSAQFPNTGAGQPPYRQPSVGFGPGDHSFLSDYALVWWNPMAKPYGAFTDANKGSWCYVAGGARFAAGRFPANADELFFNPNQPCR